MLSPSEIQQHLEQVLLTVQKPGRYVGGELNQVKKPWQSVKTHVALVFPDIYDIGTSNLGLAILYDALNQRTDVAAERAFCPWTDMEAVMRQNQIPLYSLESKRALADFDILGITIPYETLYTNVLNLLDLAGIPLYAADRTADHPLVIGGGHAAYNPEPVAAFFDAFVIGEGEEVVHEVVDAVQTWRQTGRDRRDLLLALANIWGVYVPSLYQPRYNPDGTMAALERLDNNAPLCIKKRIVSKLPPPPTRLIVPSIDVVHNRIPIEIMRGCTRGCRFCHAGMVTRPVRERPVEEVLTALRQSLDNTGFEEVALLSLSSSDYSQILQLANRVSEEFGERRLKISLPSLRIETFSVDLMEALKNTRGGNFTLAPEAATERMRNIINKPISSEDLLATVRAIYCRNWRTIKLYFMIGHPQETLEDVQEIANLCRAVMAEGKKIHGNRAALHIGVSTFVPKPHTPFQWVACDTPEQIKAKQSLLKKELSKPGIKLNWTDPYETLFEAWLSRGDRRLSEVIYAAWMRGAKFDAWQEHFNLQYWLAAFADAGLSHEFYTQRTRFAEEILPWDHIDAGVRKAYLCKEYQSSLEGVTRPDCRQRCDACGILPGFANLRREHAGSVWKCPEIKRENLDEKIQSRA